MSSDLRMKIARDIWQHAIDNDCWITISYLPGVLNLESDHASRVWNDRTEWMIAPPLFHHICKVFSIKPCIDLFASRLNNQLPIYASFGPDPNCTYVDGFSFNWGQFNHMYAYPPFNLISRFLAKMRQDRAKGILICPMWPNQAWFPMMLNMCTQSPLVLPIKEKSMLTLPWKLDMIHPNLDRLKLLSVALSGIDTDVKAFQKNLPAFSSMDITTNHKYQTLQQQNSGICFVGQGKLIRCTHLSCP